MEIEHQETHALAADSAHRSIALLLQRRRTIRMVLVRLALRNRNAEDIQDLAYLFDLLEADDEEMNRLASDIHLLVTRNRNI